VVARTKTHAMAWQSLPEAGEATREPSPAFTRQRLAAWTVIPPPMTQAPSRATRGSYAGRRLARLEKVHELRTSRAGFREWSEYVINRPRHRC
jgi:hypothetical protein